MNEMKIDVQQIGLAVTATHNVLLPDLVEKGSTHCAFLVKVQR